MKQIVSFLIFITAFFSPLVLLSQESNIQKQINILKQDTLFSNSVTAIKVMDSKGITIASWNPNMPLLTASTMKTITTGIALKVLGKNFQFKTQIGHTGFIKNGILHGNLHIIGGGDPTLGSIDTLGIPVDTLFMNWTTAIKNAGIIEINGNIIADDRFFEHEIIPTSWAWSNIGTSFGNGPSGLSFNENQQVFTFIPGSNIGDSVTIKNYYPAIPNMEYKNHLLTGGKRTGDRSAYYISDLSKKSLFTGSIAAGADSTLLTVSNKFPHLSCAAEFQNYLTTQGINSNSLILDAKEINAPTQDQMTIIAETLSAPLYLIVNVTNRISNNFYAETLLKMIGKQETGVGSYDSARVAVIRTLIKMGVSTRGFTQEDGSGLSRQNYVSPSFFCNFYAAMSKTEVFSWFLDSFPIPGRPGTLENVLQKENPKLKEKMHAKSGSLSNVRCYAGYVKQKNGELLYFAILSNNYSAKTSKMQVGIEAIMRELVKY